MSATPVSWHVDDDLAQRYAGDALGPVAAASVEAHLLRCDECRSGLAAYGPADERLDAVWAGVVDRIDAPRATRTERLLRGLGMRETEARLLAATPSLQTAWVAALLLVLGFAVGAAHGADSGGAVFILVAPLLPVAGVGWAYGPAADPAFEIGSAAPYSGTRLLLLRAASVLSTCVLLAGTAGVLLPRTDWSPAAWLLPALALTATTLALGTRMSPAAAAGVVGSCWGLLVVQLARHDRAGDAVSGGAQLAALVALLTASAVLVRRHDRIDLGGSA